MSEKSADRGIDLGVVNQEQVKALLDPLAQVSPSESDFMEFLKGGISDALSRIIDRDHDEGLAIERAMAHKKEQSRRDALTPEERDHEDAIARYEAYKLRVPNRQERLVEKQAEFTKGLDSYSEHRFLVILWATQRAVDPSYEVHSYGVDLRGVRDLVEANSDKFTIEERDPSGMELGDYGFICRVHDRTVVFIPDLNYDKVGVIISTDSTYHTVQDQRDEGGSAIVVLDPDMDEERAFLEQRKRERAEEKQKAADEGGLTTRFVKKITSVFKGRP